MLGDICCYMYIYIYIYIHIYIIYICVCVYIYNLGFEVSYEHLSGCPEPTNGKIIPKIKLVK